MKSFMPLAFDLVKCREEIGEFGALLQSQKELDEEKDIRPFFEAHHQLSGWIGVCGPMFGSCDRLAFQHQLFGDFVCDLVIGDSARRLYGFVEWEDASANSIFRRQAKKSTPEWASRFLNGFAQIVDWFWKLDNMSRSIDLENRFGSMHIRYFGLLVIGRDADLKEQQEHQRWDWWNTRIIVNSMPVVCMTYDQLHAFLLQKIVALSAV